MTKHTIEHQFIKKWNNAQELAVPADIDNRVQHSVQQAFDGYQAKKQQPQKVAAMQWFSAVAASLLIAFLSWKFWAQDDVSNPDKLLLTAIEQSSKLDKDFERLKSKDLNQYVYVQKFQLESELDAINNRLAEAYLERGNLQQKLQLWHQRNRTLSQLTDLMINADNHQITHI